MDIRPEDWRFQPPKWVFRFKKMKILRTNETPVRTHDDVAAQLTSEKVGASLRIRLVRGGAVKELSVTVVER